MDSQQLPDLPLNYFVLSSNQNWLQRVFVQIYNKTGHSFFVQHNVCFVVWVNVKPDIYKMGLVLHFLEELNQLRNCLITLAF
jgi:hypothetical protein